MQPPHVAHDYQKWFYMDLIHLFRMFVDFFLAVFDNFLRMFLQTCQMSNWWLILGHSSLINFFICTCLSVVICFILISLASMPCKTFWKPYFSILFEFPHSVNYITDIATILLILCSKNVYAKFCIMPRAITSSVTTKSGADLELIWGRYTNFGDT